MYLTSPFLQCCCIVLEISVFVVTKVLKKKNSARINAHYFHYQRSFLAGSSFRFDHFSAKLSWSSEQTVMLVLFCMVWKEPGIADSGRRRLNVRGWMKLLPEYLRIVPAGKKNAARLAPSYRPKVRLQQIRKQACTGAPWKGYLWRLRMISLEREEVSFGASKDIFRRKHWRHLSIGEIFF